MKILFISKPMEDYLSDCALHGLRSLLGADCVDALRADHMYKGVDKSKLYGKGFTIFGLLDPDLPIDRTELHGKILGKYFDAVIFGSIHRCHMYLGEVLATYPPEKIAFLDGEDGPQLLINLVHRGHYFKRELYGQNFAQKGTALPIQFGIPEEKIDSMNGRDADKRTFLAPLDPMDLTTYIYDNEADYFQMYRNSMFAYTQKKAGWDCLRHYEIMACNCIPWFRCLESCPEHIMVDLPKKTLLQAKCMLENDVGLLWRRPMPPAGVQLFEEMNFIIQKTLREKLTTKCLAKRILDRLS